MFEETLEKPLTKRLFATPASHEDAVGICTAFGKALVVLAGLWGGIVLVLVLVAQPLAHGPFAPAKIRLGMLLVPLVLGLAALLALLGVQIWKARSRTAAVIVLSLAVGSAAVSLARVWVQGLYAVQGLFLEPVWLWAGVRVVQGTFAAHRLAAAAPDEAAGAGPAIA